MAKIEIYTGFDFSQDFILVKKDGSTAEPLLDGDTASFYLSTSGHDSQKIFDNIPLTIVDASNGAFNLTLGAEQTSTLTEKLGFEEDGYSSLSGYQSFVKFELVQDVSRNGDLSRLIKTDIYVTNTGF